MCKVFSGRDSFFFQDETHSLNRPRVVNFTGSCTHTNKIKAMTDLRKQKVLVIDEEGEEVASDLSVEVPEDQDDPGFPDAPDEADFGEEDEEEDLG